ncbi:unnamed protein product [Nippostrongylus brasiliensis]|uniref:EGF-like domain-containing protein n=1 Tax=Nippostrongylus brasiliensis TaxID=27835 RepID=A0A0N4YW36_NIPBR|nr:unnamed protein product [Nippostrongylus brasiliensis]
MFVNTALLSVLIFQLFVLIDSSIRPGQSQGKHWEHGCGTITGAFVDLDFMGYDANGSSDVCSYTESKYVEDASKRCLIGVEGTIEVCECFEGYTGSLCERPVEQLPLRLVPDPRELLDHQRHSPYAHDDTYHQNDPQEEAVEGYWTTGIYQWIVFLLVHIVILLLSLDSIHHSGRGTYMEEVSGSGEVPSKPLSVSLPHDLVSTIAMPKCLFT